MELVELIIFPLYFDRCCRAIGCVWSRNSGTSIWGTFDVLQISPILTQ